MDRQEAVQRLSKVARISVANAEDFYDSFFEKPVVPQYVADWYEKHKGNFETNLFRAINLTPTVYREGELSEFQEWIVDEHTKPFLTLVNMHHFGYEIDEEKRYTVKLKSKNEFDDYLVDTNGVGFRFYSNLYTQSRTHTRKELEDAGFGWVFDCPGVEVKEVTDE